MQNLTLEIGQVHHVAVDQPNGADSCRGQIQWGRGAKTAGPDDKNPGFIDFLLPLAADFRQYDMPAVAVDLFFGKVHWNKNAENVRQLRTRLEENLNGLRRPSRISSRARPCCTNILSSAPSRAHASLSNIEVLLNADIPFTGVAENGHDILTGTQFIGDLLGGEHIGTGR